MSKENDLIKKYKLEEAVKRIQKINEYTFYDSTMTEDNQDQNGDMGANQDQNAKMNGGMPQMDGGMEGEAPIGNGETDQQGMNGGQENMEGGEMPPMDNMEGEADPNAIGGEEMASDDGEEIEDIDMDVDVEQPGDEVVDVDELTQSQEATEFKVDNVGDKLDKVLDVIAKFNDAIEANDSKIEDLKKEFEKRNPTAQETLNLRSLSSYPFSERPDEYWKKQQEEHPNYNVISNNDVSTAEEQKEFEIRKGDIDNFNERDIMKSLGESQLKLCDFLDF